jgi:hypothetical protein
MTRKLLPTRDDDYLGEQIESAPFHRSAENDRPVFCLQGNPCASIGNGCHREGSHCSEQGYDLFGVHLFLLWVELVGVG